MNEEDQKITLDEAKKQYEVWKAENLRLINAVREHRALLLSAIQNACPHVYTPISRSTGEVVNACAVCWKPA